MLRAAMRPWLGVLWVVIVLVAGSCDQDEGEPCQTDRDCASGLECNRAIGSDRGECVAPEAPTDEPDASSSPDEDATAGGDDAG